MSRKAWSVILVGVILFFMGVLMVFSMRDDAPTSDEPPHLMSGYAALKFGDTFVDTEHPLLAKTIAAVPLLFQKVEFNGDDPNYVTQKQNLDIGKLFKASRRFLNYHGNNPDPLLFSARIPMIILTVFFGLIVFLFTRKLFGDLAGVIATFLYATEPNLLAHGHLVATDIPGMGFLLLAVFSFLLYSEKQSTKRLVFLIFALAAAFLAKYSTFYLFPIVIVLMEFVYRRQKQGPREHMLFVIASVLGIISLFYGLLSFRTYGWFGFLPVEYFKGLIIVQVELAHDQRFSYLLGEAYYGSRWYYFPIMFLAKTQLLTIVFFFLTPLFLLKKKLPVTLEQAAIIFLPMGTFVALAFMVKFNIGVRHIFPIYPFVIIFASGSLAAFLRLFNLRFTKNLALFATVVVLSIFISGRLWTVATTYPGYLSYYNIAFGGTENGWKISDDSNYDWGQDIKRFANLVKEKGIASIALDNYTNDFAAKDYYKAPTFRLKPTDTSYKGYLALSTSVITYHQQFKDNYSWVVDNYQPIARAGKSIFIYKVD